MEFKLEIPYFLEGLDGARNLFSKIILMDIYKTQQIKGNDTYIILNSSIMCKKFEVDRKTYFNSLKKLEELGYIKRDGKAFTNELINGNLRKKQTRIIVNMEKMNEQFRLNDLKGNEIKEEIKRLYFKNNFENLDIEPEEELEIKEKISTQEIEEFDEKIFPF